MIGALIGTWVTARVGKKGEYEAGIIKQLQTDLESERANRAENETRMDKMQDRLDSLETRVGRLQRRDLLWDYHASRVENQVRASGQEPVARPRGLEPLNWEDIDG